MLNTSQYSTNIHLRFIYSSKKNRCKVRSSFYFAIVEEGSVGKLITAKVYSKSNIRLDFENIPKSMISILSTMI